jgi:phosphatidylglycerophosphate synthase
MSQSDRLTHQQRLERIKRPADYPLTIALINPINRVLVGPLAKTGVPPTAVTLASFVVGIAAAVALYMAAQGFVRWLYVAPLLVFVAHLFDALDGDLARYTGKTSEFGAALDPVLDRAREFLYALAVGAGLSFGDGPALAWLAAIVCIGGVQVYYYTTDAQVSRLKKTGAHDVERFSVTKKTGTETALKFGLYEPYQYGLAVAVAAGFGYEALWVLAVAFWLAWIGQIVKMWRIAAGS